MSDPANHFVADVRTKFICTLGPASDNEAVMEGLIRAGASIFRNNFAHAPYDEYRERRAILQRLNERLGTNVQMQADIQGTNIRIGELPGGQLSIIEHTEYTFVTNGGERQDGDIPINDDHLHNEVKAGEPITFVDGALEGEILAVDGHRIRVVMTNGGTLKQKKSVNVPNTEIARSSTTPKDRADLDFLINDAGVDWLAVSFVGCAADVEEVRALVGDKPIKLMSKIERRTAIENLHEIVVASDALMVARGDLGIELPMEEIPVIGKRLIQLGHEHGKPVVIATQMLMSMTDSLRPTRAEVSDVSNAVFDRADAVMLSEETAAGAHPVHALETMVRIVRHTEKYIYNRANNFEQFGL